MMLHRCRPSAWPLTVKVPMLVAALTVAVAVVISNVVLRRLAADQEANLRDLTQTYLDGLSTAVIPAVIRGDVWEAFDTLDRAKDRYSGVQARYAVVTLRDGSVLAASDAHAFPVGSRLPDALSERFQAGGGLVIDEAQGLAWVRRTLRQEGIDLGRIVAEIDIRDLLEVRREVLVTLILVNGGLTVLFGTVGYVLARRMVRPLSLLTDYVDRVRNGTMEPIPNKHLKDPGTEFGRLFASFNAMAAALREREALAARLAKEEKVSQLGKLASGMAHEVNNPLGGMLNLVDTLRKHGHDRTIRHRSLDLLERGLKGIGNVVRATLATYKSPAEAAQLRGRDLDDLQFLLQHEVARRRLCLAWRNALPERMNVDGAAVRQIALNLLLNACTASPQDGVVEFDARTDGSDLVIVVRDQGPGLPEGVARLFRQSGQPPQAPADPIGLGIWTVCHLIAVHRGRVEVQTGPGMGTILTVILPIGHEARLDAVA